MAMIRMRGSETDPYVSGARPTGRTAGMTTQVNAPTYQPSATPQPVSSPWSGLDLSSLFPSMNTRPGETFRTSGQTTSPYNGGLVNNRSVDQDFINQIFQRFGFSGSIPGLSNVSQLGSAQPYDGNLQAYVGSLLEPLGGMVTMDNMRAILPQLNAIGVQMQNQARGDLRPRLYTSQGETVDLGHWGQPWSYTSRGFGSGGGGMFGDPLLSQFASLGQFGIDQLLQPQAINPILQQAIDAITGLLNTRDSGYEAFAGIANKRLGQLDQPAFTDAQRAMIQTNYTEPLEAQRGARKQQALERAAARGMAPSSGLLELDTRDIDRSFDQMRGEGTRQLALAEIAANEARQQEAVQIGQALASLSGKNLPIQMSAANQLAGIGSGLQNDGTNRLLQALGISGQLAALPGQQMMMSLQALNQLSPQPVQDQSGQFMNLLLALAGMGQNQANQQDAQDAAFWQSLFGMLPGAIGAFTGGNTAVPRPA